MYHALCPSYVDSLYFDFQAFKNVVFRLLILQAVGSATQFGQIPALEEAMSSMEADVRKKENDVWIWHAGYT